MKDKIKLHLGCGDKIIKNFLNIDVRNLPGVDLVDDVKNLKFIENNSVELLYASHVLEHFGRREYLNILKRWYDVICFDGILRISVPDFEKISLYYNNTKNLENLLGLLWGGQNYAENYHYMGWDFDSLKKDLIKVGFREVKRYNWRDTEHSHIDDFSQAYLPHMDKENGMLMSLNIEALK